MKKLQKAAHQKFFLPPANFPFLLVWWWSWLLHFLVRPELFPTFPTSCCVKIYERGKERIFINYKKKKKKL
jgi:hypothetical protein